MSWPLFLNAPLLGFLAALSIPILIHLLLRIRKLRMKFSTLLFFRKLDEESARRRKMKNWLLLAARIVLLALLALAFARPYWPDSAGATPGQIHRQVIVVLDRTASMLAVEREGQRWERAKKAMKTLVAELKPEDRAALIGCAVQAEIISEPVAPGELVKLLDNLAPNYGSGELGKALQLATRMMERSGPAYTNLLCIVSDLQRASCRSIGSYPIPQNAELKLLNFGDLFTPNLAVAALQLAATNGVQPNVTLASFSDEDATALQLALSIDGKENSRFQASLAAATTTNLSLQFPALAPGWHDGLVRLLTQDALALDNVRYQTFHLPTPLRSIIVEPRQSVRVYQEESFFVLSAMDPMFEQPADARSNRGKSDATKLEHFSPFSAEKCAPDALAGKLQLRSGEPSCDVVILPSLKTIPSELPAALSRFVKAGGGLLLFLGEAMSLNRYQSEFGELLPAQLGVVQNSSELDWHLWDYDERSPIFAAFRTPGSGNLGLATFRRRVALNEVEGSSTVARFQDGMPALVCRNVGKGRVVLVNTTADIVWSDWPKHKTFVPWVHSVLQFLANQTSMGTGGVGPSFLAGETGDIELPATFHGAKLRLVSPDGKQREVAVDEQGHVPALEFSVSGIYSLRDAQGVELQRLAVNVPNTESDLTAISPADFNRNIARLQPSASPAANLQMQRSSLEGRQLWRPLLLAALVILFLETALANRTLA